MADQAFKWPRSFRSATALPADEVGAIVEALIAELDRREPDDDLELTGTEDDFMDHGNWGPGCSISDPGGAGDGEDDEEDDPSGQCDEDGINTSQSLIAYTPGSRGAGCPISDPDAEHDGREPEHAL